MKKILIVDDEEDIVNVLKLVLQKEYAIEQCTTAEGIYDSVERAQPDLILLDNQMGNVTAAQIIEQLKERIPGFSTPFIIFSGSIDAAVIAMETGASGFIEKPSDINYIREYIARFI